MSIYTALLRRALDEEPPQRDRTVEQLMSRFAERRVRLAIGRSEPGRRGDRGAAWTVDLIAHDVALIHLCDRLGIGQALGDPATPPTERDRLLAALAAREFHLAPGVVDDAPRAPLIAAPHLPTIREHRPTRGAARPTEEVAMPEDLDRTDQPALETISAEECLTLLQTKSVGRLVVVVADEPDVFTVNYVVVGSDIVFRTAYGLKFTQSVLRRIAFSVDAIDEVRREGWSIVLRGVGEEVTEEFDQGAVILDSWAGGGKDHWVRMVPRVMVGRRLVHR